MNIDEKDRVETELEAIEKAHDVTIVYACESGSRAWGFESIDSDYDVRFIYVHRPEWYLSLVPMRDVIERPITDDLDINGWDLKKALILFRKSNPPLLEWLHSPIIYRENETIMGCIRAQVARYYSPRACLFHYLHMARGNYRDYLQGETVWLKKYLYVLRPILACMYITEYNDQPVPVFFEDLVRSAQSLHTDNNRPDVAPDGAAFDAIWELLRRKKLGQELDRGQRILVLNEFVEAQLDKLTTQTERPAFTSDWEPLNQLFLDTLERAWGKPMPGQ